MADVHDVLHVRETFAVQVAALAVLQFRQHLVGHVDVVALPCSVRDAERMHIGVLAEILQLVLLVVGVHGDEHRTDLRGGVEEGEPIRHVRRPDTHVTALLHTDGDQAFRQVVHTFVEDLPCETEVAVRIDDIFLIWGFLRPILEPLPQCPF